MNAFGQTPQLIVARSTKRVTARLGGVRIADSARAQVLREGELPPVFYIPFEDVDQTLLKASDHETYCPHKGIARYWHAQAAGLTARNAVWAYDRPAAPVRSLKGHLAFNSDQIEIEATG